jgi:hypothetical protein
VDKYSSKEFGGFAVQWGLGVLGRSTENIINTSCAINHKLNQNLSSKQIFAAFPSMSKANVKCLPDKRKFQASSFW